MPDESLTLAALRQQRELAIGRLCTHFALDHLEAEELEQRIDLAHRAVTSAELALLFKGLPALDEPPSAPGSAGAEVGGSRVVVALMGGAERKGGWTPAPTLYVTAFMGGVLLDFREARLTAPVTEVYVAAVMGGVEIVVPPGVRLESNGIGIMGGFEQAGRGKFPVDSTVPVIRVTGVAVMGGVDVRVKESSEHDRRMSAGEERRLHGGEPRDGAGWAGSGDR